MPDSDEDDTEQISIYELDPFHLPIYMSITTGSISMFNDLSLSSSVTESVLAEVRF